VILIICIPKGHYEGLIPIKTTNQSWSLMPSEMRLMIIECPLEGSIADVMKFAKFRKSGALCRTRTGTSIKDERF
jgi:hypothetical protein